MLSVYGQHNRPQIADKEDPGHRACRRHRTDKRQRPCERARLLIDGGDDERRDDARQVGGGAEQEQGQPVPLGVLGGVVQLLAHRVAVAQIVVLGDELAEAAALGRIVKTLARR